MKKTIIALKKIEVTSYHPRTNTASIKISFQKDSDTESMYKDIALAKPEEMASSIIKSLKERSKTELMEADDLLGSVVVIEFHDEERIEERLFSFLAKLCEKARYLKHMTNHAEYMKTFDEIKIQRASF